MATPVAGSLRQVMKKNLGQWNWVLLKWAVVPLLTFLLAGLVARKLVLGQRGVETERFNQAMRETRRQFDDGDRAAALEGLARAGRMAPGDPAAQGLLAGQYQALGEHKKAAEALESALRHGPKAMQTATNYARLSEYCLQHGYVEKAKSIVSDNLLVKWPDALPTAFIQGKIALLEAQGKGDIEAAAKCFQKCLALDPDHAPSRLELGIAYSRLGELDRAELLFRAALEKQPLEPGILYHLGEVLRQQGKADEATKYLDEHKRLRELHERRKHLETLYLVKEHQPTDLLELGRILQQLGQYEKAAYFLRDYTRLNPADAEGQRELAQACERVGDEEGTRIATELANALSAVSRP